MAAGPSIPPPGGPLAADVSLPLLAPPRSARRASRVPLPAARRCRWLRRRFVLSGCCTC
uniref:Uncharacterized protein n=1 Tax=Arundo donax TaxID=35708 RepID=A0A0A9B743_ARUDO